jgi:hypothetical protein
VWQVFWQKYPERINNKCIELMCPNEERLTLFTPASYECWAPICVENLLGWEVIWKVIIEPKSEAAASRIFIHPEVNLYGTRLIHVHHRGYVI